MRGGEMPDRWVPVQLGRKLAKATVGRAYNAFYGLAHRQSKSHFCIVPGYRHRAEASYFDDTANADEWQKEVYIYAQSVMRQKNLHRVYDVGCGSGFKLVTYLADFAAIGFDVPETVEFLRAKYPNREWRAANFEDRDITPAPDMVVCSDVIEHVPDPDKLIEFILALRPRYVVLSTPDRNLLYRPGSPGRFGPPSNRAHLREWSSEEFATYIARKFTILDHLVTNREQATQMIFAVPGAV
jgi:SAM-dependent methyltransferase